MEKGWKSHGNTKKGYCRFEGRRIERIEKLKGKKKREEIFLLPGGRKRKICNLGAREKDLDRVEMEWWNGIGRW